MALRFREKVLLGLAVLIGLVMGFDQFVTYPKKKENRALEKEVHEATERITTATASLVNLQAVRKRVEEKRRAMGVLSGRIADERQLDLLLEQWGKESRLRNIRLVRVDFKEAPPDTTQKTETGSAKKAFKKMEAQVEWLAEYGSIGPGLGDVFSLPLLMELEEVDITRKDEHFPRLEVILKKNLFLQKPARKGSEKSGQGG
jgi:Tfp pilus assembly protein PilO